VYISETVISELTKNPDATREKMLAVVKNFVVLPITDAAQKLAQTYIEQGIFPAKYYDDALHVAIASANQVDILMSWNFTHLVKLKTRRLVAFVNTLENVAVVEIIAPVEL
jgi:hypothetical protein